MQLIVLTGLVVVEKQQLTLDIAHHYLLKGQRVAIVDNMARLHFAADTETAVDYHRLEGDMAGGLASVLNHINADVTLLAVSETMPPDTLFVMLDSLHDTHPGIEVTTLALIDTRTCDCFPQLRHQLETYADLVINMPVDPAGVIEKL